MVRDFTNLIFNEFEIDNLTSNTDDSFLINLVDKFIEYTNSYIYKQESLELATNSISSMLMISSIENL